MSSFERTRKKKGCGASTVVSFYLIYAFLLLLLTDVLFFVHIMKADAKTLAQSNVAPPFICLCLITAVFGKFVFNEYVHKTSSAFDTL